MFNSKALLSAESQLIEQMEHVSRPYLSRMATEDLALDSTDVMVPTRILPLKSCSVCSTTRNAPPMASVEVNTC